jgi:hypothetical protein
MPKLGLGLGPSFINRNIFDIFLPPLTIDSGVLKLNSVPFSGVGVNYYSAFERVLYNVNNSASYDNGFKILKDFKIPFVRLDISGYWPIYTQLFFNNRTEYFNMLDGVVNSALRNNIGLIPTFFWTIFTYSDLAGERLDQIAVTESNTRQRMREFATEVINRYKKSTAIWAWEFGNEWNLGVDLPNGASFLPTLTALGNPATRDPVRDDLSTDIMLPALVEFGNIAKQLDPKRPISTGHSLPRPSQWHQDQWKRGLLPIGSMWDTDTNAEAEEITLRHNPIPYDFVSYHYYYSDISRLANYTNYAKNAGRVPFVGEFGTEPAQETSFLTLLSTVTANAPIGAVWVYDRPAYNLNGTIASFSNDPYNITSTNNRSWMLSAIAGLPTAT